MCTADTLPPLPSHPPFLPLSRAIYYVKVMKKVLDKGAEYVQTEYDRLGRILGELTSIYTHRAIFATNAMIEKALARYGRC